MARSITPAIANSMTSTEPLLHCSATWHALAATGIVLPNRPAQDSTRNAMKAMQSTLLDPLCERFGVVLLTYGFASAELTKAVKKRALEGGWLPNISPANDQHAGYELNSRGNRICAHDGIAVDLRVAGVSSEVVVQWVFENLPFHAIYLYGADRLFHLSWAAAPRGMLIRMLPKKGGGVYPKVIVRARSKPGASR